MIEAILGYKKEQSEKFLVDGTRIPVTQVDTGSIAVVGIKTKEKEGYNALQIGIGKRKNPTKSVAGVSKKAKLDYTPFLIQEIAYADGEELPEVGSFLVSEQILKAGDIVDVTGTSKGKGFAGGVKRYHFRGGPRTHGQSDRERAPGSIGQTTTPGRVYKGKRMAGKMGHERVTVKNLEVVGVSGSLVLLKGLVPGSKQSIITIKKTGELKTVVPLLVEEQPQTEQVAA